MLDSTDIQILKTLKDNSRLQWREIGEQVHLTGQAVANRIRRMEDLGVIKGYSVNIDPARLGQNIFAYITVYMKTVEHHLFQEFIKESSAVVAAHRVSGEGCYILQVRMASMDELNHFLDALLRHGNYKVNMAIGEVK